MPVTEHAKPRPAIFLDRDDTINRNADLPDAAWQGVTPGDMLKPEFALLLPGVREALIALKDHAYTLVVITNQGGVARAGGTMRDVDACNDRLRALLHQTHHTDDPYDDPLTLFDDPLIDTWYSCPFHPQTGVLTHLSVEHEWRKPHPGMVLAACTELNLDPARSWMIGDKQRDLDAAIGAGVPESQTIRVGRDSPVHDLAHAARLILELEEPAGDEPVSTATLSPIDPSAHPLSDEKIRRTVESTAAALAERTGIKLIELATTDTHITATLATHKLGAIAFMAELRRATNRWHHTHTGQDLWPSAQDPLT